MILVEYLGKTIELTAAEFETIMKCPNYKYITKLGDIIKGSDVTLNDISCIPKNSEELITCLSNCTNKSCKIDLGNKHFSLSSQVFNLPRTSIYSNKNGSLDLSNVKLISQLGLDISGVDISMTNNSQLFSDGSLSITNGIFNCNNNSDAVINGGMLGNITLTDMSMTFYDNSWYPNNNGLQAGKLVQAGMLGAGFRFNNSNITFSNNKGHSLIMEQDDYLSSSITFNGGIYKFLNNDLSSSRADSLNVSIKILHVNNIIVINNPKSPTQLLFIDNCSNANIVTEFFDTSLACPKSEPSAVGCKNTYSFYGNKLRCPIYSSLRGINMVGGTWDFSNNTYTGADDYCYTNEPILIRNANISFDTSLNTYISTADVCNQLPSYNFYTLDKRTIEFIGEAAIEISNNRISLCNGKHLETPAEKAAAAAFPDICIKYYAYDRGNKVYTNYYWDYWDGGDGDKCKLSTNKTPPEYCIPPTS